MEVKRTIESEFECYSAIKKNILLRYFTTVQESPEH